MVERNLAKVEVESSRLFSRSRTAEGSRGFPFHRVGFVGHVWRRCRRRRGSKAVMHRIANPSRSVRLRPAPPSSRSDQHCPGVAEARLCASVTIPHWRAAIASASSDGFDAHDPVAWRRSGRIHGRSRQTKLPTLDASKRDRYASPQPRLHAPRSRNDEGKDGLPSVRHSLRRSRRGSRAVMHRLQPELGQFDSGAAPLAAIACARAGALNLHAVAAIAFLGALRHILTASSGARVARIEPCRCSARPRRLRRRNTRDAAGYTRG